MYYILSGENPIQENDAIKWAKWFETADRTIARYEKDSILVSTVFLGINHAFGEKTPILFETMIFGGKHDSYREQYTTIKEARSGHAHAVDMVKDSGV